jgi:hypothetical protein
MILSKNIIENNGLFLNNLNTNSIAKDTWRSGSSGTYGFYTMSYGKTLEVDRLYYFRCSYKYTTTNQNPTWCQIYALDGQVSVTGARIENPVAGTEYVLSGYLSGFNTAYANSYGTLYNGPNGAISGVVGYVKNPLVYDVTELYSFLKATGVVSNYSTLVTWCNNNLEYKLHTEKYDLSSLLNDITKIYVNKGELIGDLVECDGMQAYSSKSTYRDTYFDSGYGSLTIYNNKNNGTVTHTRVGADTVESPFYPEHKYVLKITTNGTATPGAGGFQLYHTAAANKIYIEKFVAKVPIGYNVIQAYNAQGTGSSVTALTPLRGTGNWEEYAFLYKCGTSGTFSTGGHVYISTNGESSTATNTSVTWYLAYANTCDITGKEYLKNYTVIPNKEIIKDTTIMTYQYGVSDGSTIPDGFDLNKTLLLK